MALKSKQTGLPDDFEVNETENIEQVTFDQLTFETETADLDAEAEKKEVYHTITGKEQQYEPTWETYSITDLEIGAEFEGRPEVSIFEKKDKSYNAARVRLMDNGEILNLYFNFPKKYYPNVRNLKDIRKSEKDTFDFYLNCYDVCFSILKLMNEKNVVDSDGDEINKITSINLETLLKIIDSAEIVGARIIKGSPHNEYSSWMIYKME